MRQERLDDVGWRPVFAALANDHAREVYAGIVRGESADELLRGLSPSRRKHILEALTTAGLIVAEGETLRAAGDVFRRVLASAPRVERARGVERFLDPDGRIAAYPANASERRELLALVAERVLVRHEVLSEADLNERLTTFTTDVAALRRHLVDHALVERTPSGSAYARPGTNAAASGSREP